LYGVGGTFDGSASSGRIFHFDGHVWARMAAPPTPDLWWIFGTDRADIWAVGDGATILHFDGVAWTLVDGGHGGTLYGIWGAARDDLWAVGGASGALVRHYDGRAFADTGLGADPPSTLFKVWGSNANDVFVVGEAGAILHFNGAGWTAQPSGVADRLTTVHGRSADDVYAVGGLANGVLLHYDGGVWTRVDTPDTLPGLNGVFTASDGTAFVVGFGGTCGWVSDGRLHALPCETTEVLHGIWSDGAGAHVACGGNLLAVGLGPVRGILVGDGL
jgi:hypothetical protein